jgi:membrane protease YdiL (CAAX protease family)
MAINLMEPSISNPGRRAPNWKIQECEVGVFLFLIVPSMMLSLIVTQQGKPSFPVEAIALIFRDLSLVALVLFFLWRNGEPLTHIGWTGRRLVGEAILGVVCFVPFFLSAALLERFLLHLGLTSPSQSRPSFLTAQGPAEFVLGGFLVAVVALAEETIFRGYLLLRFQALLRNTPVAVLLSSAIFAIGHGYEGSAGVVTVGFMGVVFALLYLWRRSLVAPIVMHFLQDFLGIVLLPLLGLK